MLLVKPPDRDTMLEVIAGLQSGELSRTEVVSWQMAVLNRFGNDLPLSVEDGLWYFYSFGFLEVPLVEGDSSTFFLRDMDFFEYQMDIEQVPANEVYEGVRRMRSHEANTSSPPNLSFSGNIIVNTIIPAPALRRSDIICA